MTNPDLSKLYNAQLFSKQPPAGAVGEPSTYEAADFADLPFAEELAGLVSNEVNRQYAMLYQWLSRVGFIYDKTPSFINKCFPLLILAKDANDDTPNYVVNMMDFVIWDDELQRLSLADGRRVLSVVCYDKRYNSLVQNAFTLCQNQQNFNLFLYEEILVRCLADQVTTPTPDAHEVELFKVQQVLFLLLQKHQEDIKKNYAMKSYQYADNIVQSMTQAHALDEKQLKAYVEQIFDDKPLPIKAKETQSYMPLQTYFDLVDKLPLYLARSAYHHLILAMLFCLDKVVVNVEINPLPAEPDLSSLESFIKGIFGSTTGTPAVKPLNTKLGVEVSLTPHPFCTTIKLMQGELSVFYELMSALHEGLAGLLKDEELAQKTVHAIMYRTCLNAYYYPQARLFCKQTFDNFGYRTTVVSFNDKVERYIDHLLGCLPSDTIDENFKASLSIKSLIALMLHHKSCCNALLLNDLLADILSKNTQTTTSQMLCRLILEPLLSKPDCFDGLYISTVSLDDVEQEIELARSHRLIIKSGRGDAFFIAAPALNARQVESLYNLFTHVASINPMFLYQLPVGMDYFDKSILKHMDQKLKGQATHYPFTPMQAKLLGSLQEKIMAYYNEEQLLKLGVTTNKAPLNKYLYLNQDKSVVAAICQHSPISAKEAFGELVAAKRNMTKKLSGFYELHAAQFNRSGRFNTSELKNAASVGEDASFFNNLKDGEEYLYLYKTQLKSQMDNLTEPSPKLSRHSQLVHECCHALLYGLMPVYVIMNEQKSDPLYLHQKLGLPIHGIPSMYFNKKQIGLLYLTQLPLLQAVSTPAIWQLCLTGYNKEKLRLPGDYVLDNIFDKADVMGMRIYKLFIQVKTNDAWEHRETPDFLRGLNRLTQEEFMRCFGDAFNEYQEFDDKLIVLPTALVEQDLGQSLVDAVI